MCDKCVIDAVKNKMLSRRDLFRAGAAGGALAVMGSVAGASAALAQGHRAVADMTHELHRNFPTYFGEPQFFMEPKFVIDRDGFNGYEIRVDEHTGTHIDAPLHFSTDGPSVAELPLSTLVAPLCVIDIRARAAEDADTQVTPDDLTAWMGTHGDIPANACVAMNSGWSAKVGTDGFRNADADGRQHFPGFHVEAAEMLIQETGATSIAVDTLSLDYGISADFATHYSWLPSGRFGIENIANLDRVPAAGATLVIGAPKNRGGTGGPARIFALV